MTVFEVFTTYDVGNAPVGLSSKGLFLNAEEAIEEAKRIEENWNYTLKYIPEICPVSIFYDEFLSDRIGDGRLDGCIFVEEREVI